MLRRVALSRSTQFKKPAARKPAGFFVAGRIRPMFDKLKSLLGAKASLPAVDGAQLKKQGDVHLRGGRLDEAASCYRQALVADPGHVDAHVALGFALGEQGQLAEAEAQL